MAFAGRAWKEEAVRLLCAEAAAGKVPEDEAVGASAPEQAEGGED